MEDLVIREKDIVNLGRKTMKEVYKFLHDDYILTAFNEMEEEKEKLKNNLFNKFLFMYYNINSNDYTERQYEEYSKNLNNKSNYNIILKKMISKIEDESLDIEIIYKILEETKLEFEINEDLFVKKKAFIYFYTIYYLYDEYLYDDY